MKNVNFKPPHPVPHVLPSPQIHLTINGTAYRVQADGNPEDHGAFPDPIAQPPLLPLPPASQPNSPFILPQPARQFAFSERTALVSTDVVRAVLGVDAATVAGMVEAGELSWVFDLSASPGRQRELRYWALELLAPRQCQVTPARALQLILGKRRQRWRSTEIEQLLLASRATILRWHSAGHLPGEMVDHSFWATREHLAAFLISRLCHHN